MSESELPPPRVRGQRSGKCRKCRGAIRFYPRPGVSDADAEADELVGNWAHMDRADWVDDPHEPEPEEEG